MTCSWNWNGSSHIYMSKIKFWFPKIKFDAYKLKFWFSNLKFNSYYIRKLILLDQSFIYWTKINSIIIKILFVKTDWVENFQPYIQMIFL